VQLTFCQRHCHMFCMTLNTPLHRTWLGSLPVLSVICISCSWNQKHTARWTAKGRNQPSSLGPTFQIFASGWRRNFSTGTSSKLTASFTCKVQLCMSIQMVCNIQVILAEDTHSHKRKLVVIKILKRHFAAAGHKVCKLSYKS